MATRAQVVAKAREYVGTPFAHQGRIKGVGLDCVGLPLCVAQDLGLRDNFGQPIVSTINAGYTHQPVGTYVLDMCGHYIRRKPLGKMQPGDVLVMLMLTAPCHVGIYAGEVNGVPNLIHAYNGGSYTCVEHAIDQRVRERLVAAFEFPGLED